MKLLILGDVMGSSGRDALKNKLPKIIKENKNKIFENEQLKVNLENLGNNILKRYDNLNLLQRYNNYFFTDKSLENFFYIELILKIFAGSRDANYRGCRLGELLPLRRFFWYLKYSEKMIIMSSYVTHQTYNRYWVLVISSYMENKNSRQ